MLKITDGRVTLFVTPGAYRNIYAPQGFKEVNPKTTAKDKIESKISPEIQPDKLPEAVPKDVAASEFDASAGDSTPTTNTPEPYDEDLSEIPLGEMDSDQLRAYAKQLGVDLKGMTSKKAVRDKIKAAL